MKGRGFHRTSENEESKKELEMNGNDKVRWNKSIGMKMDRSEYD